eukprot:4918228-Amphidinium_carterae.1
MFNGSFCEREADYLGIDAESCIFLEVVRWIYCRDASVDKEIVLEVMSLADHYGLEELEDHCARALAAHNLAGAPKQVVVEVHGTSPQEEEEEEEEEPWGPEAD